MDTESVSGKTTSATGEASMAIDIRNKIQNWFFVAQGFKVDSDTATDLGFRIAIRTTKNRAIKKLAFTWFSH
jgi:hypothetical protein